MSLAHQQELEAQANRSFEDAVTGLGLLPGDWRVEVSIDDILGPVPRMLGPGGQRLHIADFERRLIGGEIELPAV